MSITKLMKSALAKKPKLTYEEAEKIVKKAFKNSAFNRRHYSWYRCKAAKKQLKGVR